MKAAVITGYGGEDVVEIIEMNKPEPGENEVLIAVHAAGVNPWDVKVREGVMGDKVTFPYILGGDLAGEVVATGPGVTDFNRGQLVYGGSAGKGSFAEFSVGRVDRIALKPEQLSFVEAGALPLVASAAYQALLENAQLQAGQKVLIHGGAGGIGSTAIQIAKHLGAIVATTASAGQTAFVEGLGADRVIDYGHEDFTQQLSNYDAVFDTVGGDTYRRSYRVLRPGGKLVSMLEQPNTELMQKYQVEAVALQSFATAERLQAINKLIKDGALTVNVDQVFSLEKAAAALEYLKTGHPHGKVVIAVKPD